MVDRLPTDTLAYFFWAMMGLDAAYMLVYYGLGFSAAAKGEPKRFDQFGWTAVVGVLLQVAVAFFNKFNLLVFACRLMCHMYATFLADLLRSIEMDPPVEDE